MTTAIATLDEQDLAVEHDPPNAGSCDIRYTMMNLPVDQMAIMQREYMDRRKQFRDWLKSVLIEGIHFGYPPFCEPKVNTKGEVGVWSKGQMTWFPKEQWTAKPSLYKAGSQFICDLLNLVPTFEPDLNAWKMLGEIPGIFAIRCRIFPRGVERLPENLVGEGMGVRKVGDKGGDANNALKMAEKCALVDAVLNAYGLSDLFTQDVEDGGAGSQGPEPGVNPEPRSDPKCQPRAKRIVDPAVLERFRALGGRWKAARTSLDLSISKDEFSRMVCDVSEVDPTETWMPAMWLESDFAAVDAAISKIEAQVPG